MGQRGSYEWDDKKAELLAKERDGLHIVDIAEAIFDSDELAALYRSSRYPSQLRAIGSFGGRLMTIVFEDRDDEFGRVTHLSNF